MSSPPRSAIAITWFLPSDLDLDDALDHERAADHERDADGDEELSRAGRDERMHVLRVDQQHEDEYRDRKERQDPARQPPLCGERVDEAAQLHPLADRLGHALEHLGG